MRSSPQTISVLISAPSASKPVAMIAFTSPRTQRRKHSAFSLNGVDVALQTETLLQHHSRSIAGDGNVFINKTADECHVRVSQFELRITVVDGSLTIVATAILHPTRVNSHGLIGQTWRPIVYSSMLMYCEGALEDYAIRPSTIFGDAFKYNLFPVDNTNQSS